MGLSLGKGISAVWLEKQQIRLGEMGGENAGWSRKWEDFDFLIEKSIKGIGKLGTKEGGERGRDAIEKKAETRGFHHWRSKESLKIH